MKYPLPTTIANVLLLWAVGIPLACGRHPQTDMAEGTQVVASAVARTASPPRSEASVQSPAESGRAQEELCHELCVASAKLGCKRANGCRSSCLMMVATKSCGRELNIFFECLKSQPLTSWECVEDGSAAIREGFCDKEQGDFAACLQRDGAK